MSEEPETTYHAEPEELDEIGFDEPAGELFTPLALQGLIRNAYSWQARARADLFNAARTAEWRKRELRQKQTQLRMGEAYSLLKNAEMRETYLASECAELIALQDAAENELAEARMYFDNASAEVEQARAILRIAELAQAQGPTVSGEQGDDIDVGLLIPRKAG
jgi:hypothetical protein